MKLGIDIEQHGHIKKYVIRDRESTMSIRNPETGRLEKRMKVMGAFQTTETDVDKICEQAWALLEFGLSVPPVKIGVVE